MADLGDPGPSAASSPEVDASSPVVDASSSDVDRRARAVERLVAQMRLRPLGDDRFEAANLEKGFGQRVFGGQVAAQALRATQHTVSAQRRAHSLHGTFLEAGRPTEAITYEVDRLRDGRSFATRRVEARQGDDRIFVATVSFHVDEPGVDYQQPMAEVPEPDASPRRMLFISEHQRLRLPFEMRELGPTEPDANGWWPATRRAWMRVPAAVGDDEGLHQCLVTYLSDLGAVYAAWAPLPGQDIERFTGASLDHALWFHRSLRADEWFLYDAHAVSNAGARGLMRATLHDRHGRLGVSVAQEALLRQQR